MFAYNVVIIIALIVVALSILGMLVRVILGPSLADRVVALDAIGIQFMAIVALFSICLLYTSPSPRDGLLSRMPSSA